MAAVSTLEKNLSNVHIDYVVGGWATINQHGRCNALHIRPESDWSCVYRLRQLGMEDCGYNGKFELRDPRLIAQTAKLERYGFARSLLIDPEPGKLIMFPSWREHSVHPFYGTWKRISIAVNIEVTGGRHAGLE